MLWYLSSPLLKITLTIKDINPVLTNYVTHNTLAKLILNSVLVLGFENLLRNFFKYTFQYISNYCNIINTLSLL